tara:strand:- start:120 stop:419 length:300 start_codon:yes stop_codon:yes gene_type:complete
VDKRKYLTRFHTEIGSIDDIRDYLYLEFYLSAQARGLTPREALREHGMTFNELVTNHWDSFMNQNVCVYINPSEVERTSPLISDNGFLTLVEDDEEEIQ